MSRLKVLRDILAVMTNDFGVFRRNRSAILISLVVIPFFFTVSLGAGQGGAGTTFRPTAALPIAFVDNDLSVASGRLYETLVRSEMFNRLIQGYREDNALAALGKGSIYAAVVVPKGFQDRLMANQPGTIIVYVDDGAPGVGNAVLSAVNATVQTYNPTTEIPTSAYVEVEGFSTIQIVQKGARFSGFALGLTITMSLVIVFATFYEIAGGMSREREEGTYARLLLSPVSLGAIMIGKTLYDLGLNIVRAIVVLGLAIYVYGARPNTDFVTLLAGSVLIALLTMGFGLLISSLGVGVRAVVIIEFFLILFLFAFSGFIIDKELMKGTPQIIATYLPWSYGIEILKRTVLLGAPLLSLTSQLQFVGSSIVLFYALSYFVLKLARERLVE
jgi:ABC-2 type transport system permease protein